MGDPMNEYDRVYHEDSIIVRRPPLVWPSGHRAAFSVVVCAEYYELQPPDDAFVPPNVPGGFGRAPYPDVRAFSQREYGNRVGIFRVMEALDKHQIRATAAADAVIAATIPLSHRAISKERLGDRRARLQFDAGHLQSDVRRAGAKLHPRVTRCGRKGLRNKAERLARPGIWGVGTDARTTCRVWRKIRSRLAQRRTTLSDEHAVRLDRVYSDGARARRCDYSLSSADRLGALAPGGRRSARSIAGGR